jgi:hypothetical protein
MNKKFIIISIGLLLIVGITIFVFFVIARTNDQSNMPTSSSDNQSNTQTINSENSTNFVDNTYLPEDYSQYEVGSVPSSEIKNRLELDKKTDSTYYVYSKANGVALTYEQESVKDKKPIYVRVLDNKIYLSLSEYNIQSGQSIELINIDPNLRFNTIPGIITQQILIADEKVNCKIEDKNGRYSIIAKDPKVKDSTKMCGNYAKGNNRFFMRPIEEGSAINKLIFVNAGSQELSYDGSGRGKYWYESVIVE